MTILSTLKHLAIATLALAATVVNAASTVTYFHNDLAGSPVAATNSSGEVIWRESYRPYGERLNNSSASADNKIYFTSRRQDVETGLVYMGARYYDPVIGRFISTDPKQFDEQNPQLFNRYAYANNNPYRYVDPDGRSAQLALCAGGPAACAVGIGLTVLTAYYGAEAIRGTARALNTYNENKGQPSESSNDGGKSLDQLRDDSKLENETSRRTKIWQRDKDQRGKDFDEVIAQGGDTRTLPDGTRIGTLPDGTRLIDRGHSSDGRPTLEVQRPDGRKTDEFRYGPKAD